MKYKIVKHNDALGIYWFAYRVDFWYKIFGPTPISYIPGTCSTTSEEECETRLRDLIARVGNYKPAEAVKEIDL